MSKFEFIDKLFDKREFEMFVESILDKIYYRHELEEDNKTVWTSHELYKRKIYYTQFGVSYAEFGKDKKECVELLKKNILDRFYTERKTARMLIDNQALENISIAEKMRDQDLYKIEEFIENFKDNLWLEDLPYVLEELQKIAKEIQPSTAKSQEKGHKKLIWYAGTASLVTMFYELNTKLTENGSNYLKTSGSELEKFILENFLLPGNEKLKASTVKTYLKPSSIAKRSKGAKKVRLDILSPRKKVTKKKS